MDESEESVVALLQDRGPGLRRSEAPGAEGGDPMARMAPIAPTVPNGRRIAALALAAMAAAGLGGCRTKDTPPTMETRPGDESYEGSDSRQQVQPDTQRKAGEGAAGGNP
jgi:hypothetical protein